MKKQQVLLVLLGKDDLKRMKDFPESENYTFHHLNINPIVADTGAVNLVDFDVLSYIETAIEYVNNNAIDAVLGTYDVATLVAGIIREKTGLPGPGIETSFICFHKYYTNLYARQSNRFWYFAADPDNDDWKTQIKYPAYVKSPIHGMGFCQAKVENDNEMTKALIKIKQSTDPGMEFLKPLFKKYLDLKKFPLGIKNVVVVEEFVQNGKMMVCEGWADKNGIFHIWQHVDGLDFMQKNNARYVPSTTPFTVLQDVENFLQDLCFKLNLRSVYFNTDIWIICDPVTNQMTVELIEINKRLSLNLHDLYQFSFKKSSMETASLVALGEPGLIQPPTYMPDGGFSGVFSFKIKYLTESLTKKISQLETNNQNLKIVIYYEMEGNVQNENSDFLPVGRLFVSSNSLERLKVEAYEVIEGLFNEQELDLLV